MQGRLRTTLLAIALALTAAGCGSDSDGTIPATEGEGLVQRLDAIESALASQNCSVVTAQAEDFAQEVNELPAEVDDEVKAGLIQGAERLVALAQQPDQCEDTTGPTGEAGVEDDESTTTDLETDESTTTETTSTTTETDEEEEPAEEDTDDQGNPGQGAGPPVEVPGEGDPGGGRTGEIDSGGLTDDKEGRE